MAHFSTARLLTLVLVAAGLVAGTRPARADEPVPPTLGANAAPARDRWTAMPWLVSAHLSLGGPAGDLAVELQRDLGTPLLAAAIGVGKAIGGTQWAGTVRLRIPGERFALGLGLGASYGDHKRLRFLEESIDLDDVLWGNAEAFLEARGPHGEDFRLFAGASRTLAAGECHIGPSEASCDRDRDKLMPFVGVTVGHAF